ncbi:MAG: CynX/NimT family MFS transporter [Sedimentitalea sp.]
MTAPLTQETPKASGRWLVLGGVWLIYFSFGMTVASMAPLVGQISAELGVGNATMGAILGAWPLTYIFAAIPCGVLLDRFGARWMLFLACLIMASSGLARSVADTPVQLLLAVAAFGAGGPMISVGAPKMITGLFQGPQRGNAMGLYVTGPYLGGIVALALTNSVLMPLADNNWRTVMLIYAALVAASGVIWLILSSRRFAPNLSEGEGGKKFNLAAFSEILAVPAVRLLLVMSIGIFFINHAMNNWLPELLRAHGLSPVSAGYWAAIPSSVGVIAAVIVPRWATPDRRMQIMGALFLCTLGASVLLHFALWPALATGLFMQGVARGAMMTIAILMLMETPDVPPERLGLAGGLFFTAAEIGGVLGPVSFGVLSDLSGGFGWPLLAITGVSIGLLFVLNKLSNLR